MSGPLLSPPQRSSEDDDDLLLQAKRRKLLVSPRKGRSISMTVGQQQQVEQPAPQAHRQSKRLNLAAAVGGEDKGIEEEEARGAVAPPVTSAAPVDAPTTASIQSAEWFYLAVRGQPPIGPVTTDDLKEAYESGKDGLCSNTFVFAPGLLADWMAIENVTELYEYLEDAEALRESVKKARDDDKAAKKKKGKKADDASETPNSSSAPAKEWFDLKVNTSVYVSGLPDGTTKEQLELFFKKVGIIKTDPVTRLPKVKVYKNNDGLVTFARKESVPLALQLLDGAAFSDERSTRIHVEEAKFEKKGAEYKPRTDIGVYKQQMKKLKKTQDARLGWNEGDADPNARTVILKHAFSAVDLVRRDTEARELKDEIGKEASKFGAIDNIRLLKRSRDGVVMVRFKSFIAAQNCIQKFNGRFFDQRQLEAYMWDHKESFPDGDPETLPHDTHDAEEEEDSELEV